MNNRDCQENINKPTEDEPTVATTVAEKSIRDELFIITIAATTVVIFFGLRAMGVEQHDVLLTSTSLV